MERVLRCFRLGSLAVARVPLGPITAGAAPLTSSAFPRPRDFEVIVQRRRRQFGFEMKFDDGASLSIAAVRDNGAAQAAYSDIRRSDRIFAVSGVAGSSGLLLSELGKSDGPVFLLLRRE